MAYVSNEKDNTVTVVDTTTMQVVKTIKTGQRPRGITISHDGKFVYLCASDDDAIEIIDTATSEIVGTLPSGPDPELFVLSPDGKRLYVANEDDNLVTVIDLESKASSPKSQSAWSLKAWASAPTARRSSTRRKRRTWRISSTRKRTRSRTTCWSMPGRVSWSSRLTARRHGSAPRSAAPCR
jgi:YVTN family beta-propeller protein